MSRRTGQTPQRVNSCVLKVCSTRLGLLNANLPTGYHYFYSHPKNGQGCSESAESRNHFIGYRENDLIYQSCQKIRYYDYCSIKCSYCGVLDKDIYAQLYAKMYGNIHDNNI